MNQELQQQAEFEAEVADRFGILPNFFRSAAAAPELIQQLWGFAKAGYLDNPMPSVFKERLFVWLSRFCPMRYCIVRHVGFLLGGDHGHSAGDPTAPPETLAAVLRLLRRPSPWQRDMSAVYEALEELPATVEIWPTAGSDMEDAIFACAAVMFIEPIHSGRARRALVHAIGPRRCEFLGGCLAFIRTAHYWTMLHPEIETEEDMQFLLRGQQELAQSLLHDPEAGRCEMGERLFAELTDLRALHEREELKKAKDALEEKDRQKDQFIAVLGHELRNPLAAIRAAADAMSLLKLTDSRADRLLQRLNRQTTAMARMLDDLMDASRIALGKVSVRMESVDLRSLLQDVLDEQEPRVLRFGLHLVTQLGGEPCLIRGDQVRLRQIVDNLLANASKFTPTGGTIELALAVVAERAVVTVRDSGVGFDADFATKLFEPFTQQEQRLDRPEGGLGLGLAIASRLAQLQGGSLSAASEGAGKGALFTFSIPISAKSGDAGSRYCS